MSILRNSNLFKLKHEANVISDNFNEPRHRSTVHVLHVLFLAALSWAELGSCSAPGLLIVKFCGVVHSSLKEAIGSVVNEKQRAK